MFCASVVYPLDAEGFDLDYFATTHAPMFADMLGDNCVRWEVHTALATPNAPPPPFIAAAYFWVTSAEQFGATLAHNVEAVYADIETFSRTQPTVVGPKCSKPSQRPGRSRDDEAILL